MIQLAFFSDKFIKKIRVSRENLFVAFIKCERIVNRLLWHELMISQNPYVFTYLWLSSCTTQGSSMKENYVRQLHR